jgi:predicted outer membrane lipoprotein
MKNSIILGSLAIAFAFTINTAMANELMIFPAKGQSNEQTEKDKFSCYGWAKGQTGFDPMKVPTTTTAPPAQAKASGGVIRGGLGGAALGAIIGDSSKSAKRGLAAGALIGGVRQNSSNRATEQKTQQWQQQESSNYANNRNQYNRAYSACLEGKGYTVK